MYSHLIVLTNLIAREFGAGGQGGNEMIIKVDTDNKSWVQFGIDYVEDMQQRRYLSISWKEDNGRALLLPAP